jgi:N-acetylglucosamine kinase-like BadF-type ATPase
LSEYFLGIDGGQSSTTALIADETGRVIGYGRGGPCNHASGEAGRLKFFSAISGCVSQACEQAGLPFQTVEFAAACLGFSGGAADKESYSRELIHSERFHITHDAEIALAGATAGEPGIIMIAGTGSMAFGRNAHGETARAGGWGYVFGDEGGGFDLARRALRAALRFEEGWGPLTSLREKLLVATGAPDANTLLHHFYTPQYSRAQIAGLAGLVSEAAESGDAVALEIFREATRDLAGYVEGVHRRLFGNETCPTVAYIGGVFRSDAVRHSFAAEIERRLRVTPQAPQYSPAAGALLQALRLVGNRSTLMNLPASEK